MATISPSDQAADLLHNLSLDPETKPQVSDTVNKDVYGGGNGKPSLLANGGAIPVNKGLSQKKFGYNQKDSYGYYSPAYAYGDNYFSGKTNSLNYSYLNTNQGRSDSVSQSYGYMDSMYSMYGPYISGYGYDSYGYGTYRQTPNWYTFNNGYNTRNYGFHHGYGKENVEGLNELNRGPRFKSFKTTGGLVTLKEQNVVETEKRKEDASLPDSKDYNKEGFAETYTQAKLFVIKSYSEDDIHKSIKYNVWSSTPNGNKKLHAAYNEGKEKYPVFLLFSVNTSGQFVGLAEMVGPVDFNKTVEYWQQDKWIGCFPVKWHIVKDIPNSSLRHITLENNENKPVTNSRDTQEVHLEQGIKVIKIFKEHVSKTCILDDFAFYESREKIIQDRKKKHQQFRKQATQTDQLEETKETIITTTSPEEITQNGAGEVASAC